MELLSCACINEASQHAIYSNQDAIFRLLLENREEYKQKEVLMPIQLTKDNSDFEIGVYDEDNGELSIVKFREFISEDEENARFLIQK